MHIDKHIASGLPTPNCYDQPFIVYHAIKNNLCDIDKLVLKVINIQKCEGNEFKGQSISHFLGGIGAHKSKFEKMAKFMKIVQELKKAKK